MAIYVIRASHDHSRVKIGYTQNIQRRMAQLQTGASSPLELLWYAHDGLPEEERRLHQIFRQHRKSGEWFDAKVLERLDADRLCV